MFWVGGKGLGSVFIFLVVLVWVRPGRFQGECVGSLEWELWLVAVCLRISVLRSAAGLRCLFLGEWYGVLSLWAGQSLNQNLNSKYVNHMKLFLTLEHFSAALTKPLL